MEKTTNYKLPRWEKDDFVKMDDFNAAFQTIDETLKAGADAVADEAAARETAVTALAQDVGAGGKTAASRSAAIGATARSAAPTSARSPWILCRCWR